MSQEAKTVGTGNADVIEMEEASGVPYDQAPSPMAVLYEPMSFIG